MEVKMEIWNGKYVFREMEDVVVYDVVDYEKCCLDIFFTLCYDTYERVCFTTIHMHYEKTFSLPENFIWKCAYFSFCRFISYFPYNLSSFFKNKPGID